MPLTWVLLAGYMLGLQFLIPAGNAGDCVVGYIAMVLSIVGTLATLQKIVVLLIVNPHSIEYAERTSTTFFLCTSPM